MIEAGADLFDVLRVLALSELQHAATCPYCIADREAELFAASVERVRAMPDPKPQAVAA